MSNQQIVDRLVISPKTVRNHVSNIFSKLQVRDRAEAVVRAREAEEINKPENRGYADNGIAGVQGGGRAVHAARVSASRSTRRREIEPLHRLEDRAGDAAGLFINPGDVTLMTVPGYPVAGTHTAYYGGVVYKLPLTAENDFLPDLDSIPADVRAKAKLLVLCYPNSPTASTAPPEFYERAIAFAKKHEIVIVQDAAHAQFSATTGRRTASSSMPGATDVGVEVHSMSKGFDMIGWRIGWVCGHERIVGAFAERERQLRLGPVHRDPESGDRGARRSGDSQATRATKYKRRLKKLVATLQRCGFKCKMPGGTYFLYAPSPKASPMARRAAGASISKTPKRQPVPHHRAIDLHRPLGRCRAVPALQRDLRSGGRKGGRRADGRDRSAAQEHSAGVLVRYAQPLLLPRQRSLRTMVDVRRRRAGRLHGTQGARRDAGRLGAAASGSAANRRSWLRRCLARDACVSGCERCAVSRRRCFRFGGRAGARSRCRIWPGRAEVTEGNLADFLQRQPEPQRMSFLRAIRCTIFCRDAKIALIADCHRVLAPGGTFFWIDPVCRKGESRDAYIDRLTR